MERWKDGKWKKEKEGKGRLTPLWKVFFLYNYIQVSSSKEEDDIMRCPTHSSMEKDTESDSEDGERVLHVE